MRGLGMMRAYSDTTDALIRRILELAIDQAKSELSSVRRDAAKHIAIAAVGGYGRRQMAPSSDVDVAFLVGGEESDAVDLVVKRAFRILVEVLDRAMLSTPFHKFDDVSC